jgi:DinB superfamily
MSEQCAECGFDWDTSILESLRIIEKLPATVRDLVASDVKTLRDRPAPTVWSPHEYVWHLADTFHMAAEWMHDVRALDHPTHYAVDTDGLADLRGYSRLPLETGLWSLEQSSRLFIGEAAVTDPSRTCHYHDWQDVSAAKVVSLLTHEAVHHLFDLGRALESRQASHAG